MSKQAERFHCLKRLDDALAMRERVFEFTRRMLPKNHPEICEGDVWYLIAYFGL